MCGATQTDIDSSYCLIGLSPRVWGNLSVVVPPTATERPIPTCVGQPLSNVLPFAAMGAYPHVCGATPSLVSRRLPQRGLSPRVWGNLVCSHRYHADSGPIPTCVGQPEHN